MQLFISKVNKYNHEDIFFYQFKKRKLYVALAVWYELLEAKYMQNPDLFLEQWSLYAQDPTPLVNSSKQLDPTSLMNLLTHYNIVKLEDFLEHVWRDYHFIIKIR